MNSETNLEQHHELSAFQRKYDYTIGFRRRDWAWEFLRRNVAFAAEAYRMQYAVNRAESCVPGSKLLRLESAQTQALEWGLLFFPNPDQPAPRADVFWDPSYDPFHVTVTVSARDPSETDELYEHTIAKATIDHLTDHQGREHLLMRGEYATAQSLCSGLSLLGTNGPVKVALKMQGPNQIDRTYLAYKRAASILHPGKLAWTERSLRLRNALICLDVKDAGLTLRHAARIIFGENRTTQEWTCSKPFRDSVRSLQRTGERLRSGGYKRMLGAKGTPIVGPH